MLNAAFYLEVTARRVPEATAVIHDGRRYSYGQIEALANKVAHGLTRRGYGPGDRVGIFCPNRPGFVIAYYGIMKTGATPVLLACSLHLREMITQMRDCNVRGLFTFDGYGDSEAAAQSIAAQEKNEICEHLWVIPADPLADSPVEGLPALADLMAGEADAFNARRVDRDSTAVVIYTTGSTGAPKGSELTHANLMAAAMINLPLGKMTSGTARLVVNPLCSVMGLVSGLTLAVLCADKMILVERFEPELIWRLLVDEQIVFMAAMPVVYRWMLDDRRPADPSKIREHLRVCGTGGAHLSPEWSEEFEALVGTPIRPGYGMTEATSTICWNCPFEPNDPSTVGRPLAGIELRVVDEAWQALPEGIAGEIVIRSPGLIKGYLGKPDLMPSLMRNGFFRTGDIGLLDDRGRLRILGRKDDRFTRGDEHIYPAEIENALHEHPMVSLAAVVPVVDRALGREAKTFVVPKPGCQPSEGELLAWLDRQMSGGKCPGVIELRKSLPVSDNGKVIKRLLT